MNDEASSTGAKLQEFYSSLGIETRDSEGQLRNFYDVLGEMGGKWDTLTADQKKYYALIQAGANQSQNLLAVMENWKDAKDATQTAINSQGSAMQENEKVLDSVEGKLNKLKSALQKLSHDFMSSDLLKSGLDVVTKLIEGLDKLISAGNGLAKFPVLIGAIVGGFRIFGGVLAGTGRQFEGLSKIIDGVMKLLLGKRGFEVFTNGAGSMTKAIEGTGKAGKVAGKEIKEAVEGASVETVSLGTSISTTFKSAGEWIAKNKALLGELGVAAGVLAVIFGAIEWDKYFSMESSMERLEDYEDKAKEVHNRIIELETKKETSGLTKKEERELELLKLQNKELERQIELEKKRAEKGADKILKNGSGKMGGEKAGTENSAKYQTATDEYVNAEKELDKWTEKLKAANKEKEEFEQGKRTSYSESAIKEAELAVEHYQNVMDKAGDKQAEYATKTYDEWKQIMDAGDDYASLVEKFGIDSKEVANYQAIRKAVATMTIDADKLKDSYGEVEGAVEGGFELFQGAITVGDVDLSNVTDSVGAIQELLDNTVQNQTIEIDAEDKAGKVIGNIKAEAQDLTAEQWYAVVEARESGDWSEIKKWEEDPNLQGFVNFNAEGVEDVKKAESDLTSDKEVKVKAKSDKASFNKVENDEKNLTGTGEWKLKFTTSGYEDAKKKADNIKSRIPVGGGQYTFHATGKRKGEAGGLSWLGDEGSSTNPRPELVVTDHGAYLAGTTGWELHELSASDTVYSYADTKRMLGGRLATSGSTMMPRYAKGKKSASQKKKEKKQAEFERKLATLDYKRERYHWSDEYYNEQYAKLAKKYKKYTTTSQKRDQWLSKSNMVHDNKMDALEGQVDSISGGRSLNYVLKNIKTARKAKQISAKEAKELRADAHKNELDYLAEEYAKGKKNYKDLRAEAEEYWKYVGKYSKEYYDSLDVLREAEVARLEKKQERYSDELEYGKQFVDLKIKELEKQKAIVDKQKEQKEDAEKLVDLQNELSKARSTMVRTYKEGVGWVYEADSKAIKEAQSNLDDYLEEHATDGLQTEIDRWQKIADLFSDIADQSALFTLAEKLGVNNLYDLVKGDITDVETMAKWIKDNNTWVNSYDAMMTQLENMTGKEFRDAYGDGGITQSVMKEMFSKYDFGNVFAGTLSNGNLSTMLGNSSNEKYIQSVVESIMRSSAYVEMNKGIAEGKASESMSTVFNIDNISLPSVTDAKSFEDSLKLYATQHSYARI